MSKILWIDDEIASLTSIIRFLESRKFEVIGIANAEDAFPIIDEQNIGLIILDQMMPGLDGMGFIEMIRKTGKEIPIVLMTKIDDENFMEEVFAQRIEDILIKPVNPKQVLAICKKYLEKDKIVMETTERTYGRESRDILMNINNIENIMGWYNVAEWIAKWNIILDSPEHLELRNIHESTVQNLNLEFINYIKRNYKYLIENDEVVKSNNLIRKEIDIDTDKKVYFILFDCMRLDLWLIIKSMISKYFNVKEGHYMSILPTLTSYSRNSIFSGKFPDEMSDLYETIWNENDIRQNRFEEDNLKSLLGKLDYKNWNNFEYVKLVDLNFAGRMGKYNQPGFVAIVVNFLDMLIHYRGKSDLAKKSLPNDTAFRKIVKNWFENSKFPEFFRIISEENSIIYVTSDHGAITVKNDIIIKGSKISNIQFRYAEGFSIFGDKKNTLTLFDPKSFHLPSKGPNYRYIFALKNNYLKPKDYSGPSYAGSMQHGGISIEEMILPIAKLTPKR